MCPKVVALRLDEVRAKVRGAARINVGERIHHGRHRNARACSSRHDAAQALEVCVDLRQEELRLHQILKIRL